MAKKTDLMGLGMPFALADRLATDPSTITGGGGSIGSATAIGGDQYLVSVTASTGSTNGVVLPSIGGANGCLLGDDFIINNQTASSVIVYAAGATTTISQGGSNTSGTTGISVSVHKSMTLYPITASSWLGITA